MANLSSTLFAGDGKLEDCSRRNQDHLGEQFNPTHPSVKKIQEALEKVMSIDLSGERGTFGQRTGDAVAEFKRTRKPQLVNFEGKIDRVVGIKTIQALDALLPKGPPAPTPPTPPTPSATTTTVDFVVVYRGGGGVPTPNKSGIFGMPLVQYRTKPNRELIPLGHGGNFLDTSGELTNFAPMNTDLQAIKTLLAKAGKQVGVVCIRGNSSGGKAALKLAALLTAEKIPVRFVGIQDGAFFNRDTSNSPIPTNIPLPRVMFFAANEPAIKSLFTIDPNATKHNHWQDKQNRGQVGSSGRFWTSDLNGEIHGKLAAMGFLDTKVKPVTNQPHGEAGAAGELSNVVTIAGILNTL